MDGKGVSLAFPIDLNHSREPSPAVSANLGKLEGFCANSNSLPPPKKIIYVPPVLI